MKTRISSESKVAFNPIEITVTIESQAEFVELWHRVNMTSDAVEKAASVYTQVLPYTPCNIASLWNTLEDIRRSLGLKVQEK